MNILIIGSGGREHAIAWKVKQSHKLKNLYVLPGNPGTAQLAENVDGISVDDHPTIIEFCRKKQIDLVVVGPEAPLANGVADALSAAGIRCFGPRRAAAQIEASKSFAKQFMARHGIPTARYQIFTDVQSAIKHIETVDYPIVIKASGLAAGKGVILPETMEEAKTVLEAMLVNREFGAAGDEVVIEERLVGQEISLMAFTDGESILPMLPAQDHKRLLDGDRGPNTGGMGAYAPASICTAVMISDIKESILQPAVSGLQKEGTPFVGVLYAGLILTLNGPSVLEFNCRFGDPETQAVLPLLETDLLEIFEACVNGNLKDMEIIWKDGVSVCVGLASKGYPEKAETGKVVTFNMLPEDMVCFHAGTKTNNGTVLTAGGRVFGLTAWAGNIESAIKQVYANINKVSFDGMYYRSDIAHRALSHTKTKSAYSQSGVDIDAGSRAIELMKDAVKSTYTSSVLAGIGAFGGLFDASILKQMNKPVLVASTDGVGTKVKLAASIGRYRSIGHDIVNHCINDILVQGARPLFFMDYFATSKLTPEVTAEVVTGIAEACQQAGMVLLGGETAEMPGVYQPNEFDVAGTIVGAVERDEILPRNLKAGDVLIGLTSSGPHTNGYSLIRKIFSNTQLDAIFPELGVPLHQALLVPHRSYFTVLYPLLSQIKALAHITGGGFVENIPRVLSDDLGAHIHLDSWTPPALWKLIQSEGHIATGEMYRVFNMGIGMVAIVDKDSVGAVRSTIHEPTFVIGELAKGERKVHLIS